MLKKDVAVVVMRHLVNHDWHGYSQPHRNGDGAGNCEIVIDGKKFYVKQGDRDCSSAVIEAYESVGINCGGATYTGNMRACMVKSGNFKWHPMRDGYTAKPGDCYLKEGFHTAMCTSSVPDLLAEFSISETGGIDGKTGDQTGKESSEHAYYNYPWDGILECINKESIIGAGNVDSSAPKSNPASENILMPKYRVFTEEEGWLEYLTGLTCADGCGDNYAGVRGHLIRNLQINNLGPKGWFQLTTKRQGVLPKNAENKDMSDYVIGVTVYYDTPDPKSTGYLKAKYRVSPLNKDYLKWEYDNENDGAGDDHNGIDRLQLTLE